MVCGQRCGGQMFVGEARKPVLPDERSPPAIEMETHPAVRAAVGEEAIRGPDLPDPVAEQGARRPTR